MPPEGCDAAAGGEFPILPDAFEVTSLGEFTSYKTNTAFSAIADFYRAEMAAAGWTISSEFVTEPVAQLAFTKDGREVTVSVVEDPASDAWLVSIIQ